MLTVLRRLTEVLALGCFMACSLVHEEPFRIAAHPWPGYEFMYLAQREGWLPAEVQITETRSTTDSLQVLKNGRADAVALTLDETLRARGHGFPLMAVLVFDVSAGADRVMAGPGIDSPAALAGKRIGVEKSALGALMLSKVLEAGHLAEQSVTVVPTNVDRLVIAWDSGEVDAVICYGPTARRLQDKGAHSIFDSRQIPGTIVDVLAITPQAASRHAGKLRALIAGHFRALAHFNLNETDAAYHMAAHLGLSGTETVEAFRGIEIPNVEANKLLLDPRIGSLLQSARTLSEIMRRDGLLDKIDPMSDLISATFLP